MLKNYIIHGYTILFHKGEGDTYDSRVFFCDTSAEIGQILEKEFWAYWDGFKVYAEAFNVEAGTFETVPLP